jgi:hypothetical protein
LHCFTPTSTFFMSSYIDECFSKQTYEGFRMKKFNYVVVPNQCDHEYHDQL